MLLLLFFLSLPLSRLLTDWFYGFPFLPDVNECTEGFTKCHPTSADCRNKPGSYECVCSFHYYGDGKTCHGNLCVCVCVYVCMCVYVKVCECVHPCGKNNHQSSETLHSTKQLLTLPSCQQFLKHANSQVDQYLHIVGSKTCLFVTLLCSTFSHRIAAEIPETGTEGGGQVCHHVLTQDLHSFALQTMTLHECLTAHNGCCASIRGGSCHAKCDGVTQHGFGGDGLDVRSFLERGTRVVLSLFAILVRNFGQLLNCDLHQQNCGWMAAGVGADKVNTKELLFLKTKVQIKPKRS